MNDHEKRIREAVASGESFSDNDLRALLADLDRLRDNLDEMRGALKRIVCIQNKMFGGDWEEIEEAREIASTALSAAKESSK